MGNLTLATTTIGSLLLENKISKTRDEKKKNIPVRLSIPEYQRPYKWTARNAIQLLDDIIEAKNLNKEVYRVGTLILHHDLDNDVYNIVDGQQRTITFSLLILNLLEITGKKDEIDLAFLKEKVFDNEFNRNNIIKNFNAFKRRLDSSSKDDRHNHLNEMIDLLEFIIEHCELIVVITDDLSEAFQFFDSQNARGKSLYPHDLLKAYHLREMTDLDERRTEIIVRDWEKIEQYELSTLFGDYLYPLREWINGNYADELTSSNVHKFKGVNKSTRSPYAQFYKSAYAYADFVNSSAMPFVTGSREITAFQLNTPIIAGKPFFDFTQHYYRILKDILSTKKYEGFYLNDNSIVKTLEKYFNNGTGNLIARLLFNTSLLLYVDRFCPASFPSKEDTFFFEQFVVYAFIWAYSLRAQYANLGFDSAQNYILGNSKREIKNSMNIYRLIIDSDTPVSLLSILAEKLSPISEIKHSAVIRKNKTLTNDKLENNTEPLIEEDKDNIKLNYLYYFKYYNYLIYK